jgi:hypothetical protein
VLAFPPVLFVLFHSAARLMMKKSLFFKENRKISFVVWPQFALRYSALSNRGRLHSVPEIAIKPELVVRRSTTSASK